MQYTALISEIDSLALLDPHFQAPGVCTWVGCAAPATTYGSIEGASGRRAYHLCHDHAVSLRTAVHEIAQRLALDALIAGEDVCDLDGYLMQRRLPDRRLLAMSPQTFGHAQLGISMSPPFEDIGVFVDTWDFLGVGDALWALLTWEPGNTPEPEGWHWHASSGRYRILGQETLEYVEVPGGLPHIRQLEHALQVTLGRDRLLKDVTEEPPIKAQRLPDGCRCFLLFSESTTCEHTPRCLWSDGVFQYLDRFVVVSFKQMAQDGGIKVTEIARRLTGELEESEETWRARW